MKGKSILKAITIMFLAYVLLTWFIPTGYFSSGEYVKDAIVPIGLFDLIRYPLITMTSSVFILMGSIVILVGILYNVLNKTGAYQVIIDKLVKKYKGKEIIFLIITACIFFVLSSVTGLNFVLFVMVPFFATVILLLGLNKFSAMMSTIGAILLGNVASTYGFNVAGYVSYITNDINDSIYFKVGLCALSLGILLFTLIKTAKIGKVNKEEIMLYEKAETKSKKSPKHIIITMSIILLITFIGMVNWKEVFNISLFNDAFNNLKNIKIGNYQLFSNLIGSMYEFGSWTNYELCMMLVIAILLISLIYRVKFKDLLESIKKGTKQMLPLVFYLLVANTIFLAMNAVSNGYNIFPTLANALFNMTSKFNVFTFGLISLIGSVLYNDLPYLLGSLYEPISTVYSSDVSLIAMISQGIHGLVQIIAPTSIMLVLGLAYFDIDYTEWVHKIFKFVLMIFLALIVVVALMILI